MRTTEFATVMAQLDSCRAMTGYEGVKKGSFVKWVMHGKEQLRPGALDWTEG